MFKQICLFVVMFLLLSENKAYAYLDPGTGSIILQALAASLVAISVFWNQFKKAVSSFFAKIFAKKQ